MNTERLNPTTIYDDLKYVPSEPPPNKLSALLRLAVDDFKKAQERTDLKFIPSMGDWLDFVPTIPETEEDKKLIRNFPGQRICMGCLAGAVMLQTIKLDLFKDGSFVPNQVQGWEEALLLIDNLRTGSFPELYITKLCGPLTTQQMLQLSDLRNNLYIEREAVGFPTLMPLEWYEGVTTSLERIGL